MRRWAPLRDGALTDAAVELLQRHLHRRPEQNPIAGFRADMTRQGITGHSYSPFLSVAEANDPTGTTWGVQLAWSGSWQLSADVDTTGQTRIQAGRAPSSFGLALAPGSSWVSPVAVGACSSEGPNGLARAFHAFQRSFARDLTVDHSTLSQILRGRRRLTGRNVRAFGRRLRLAAPAIGRGVAHVARVEELHVGELG